MNTYPMARPGASSAARAPRLRLTSRGRLVKRYAEWTGAALLLVLLVVAALLVVSAVIAPGAQAGDGRPGQVGETISVSVGPGDTLWSLAGRYQPGSDPREVVADIERLNGLDEGALLPVGTRLQIPTE